MLIYTEPCWGCGDIEHYEVEPRDYVDWVSGRKHIQEALPYLTADQQEWLVSATCPKCWKEKFPPEEEDEDGDESYGWVITDQGMEALERALSGSDDLMGDEGDQPEYDKDYYVEED